MTFYYILCYSITSIKEYRMTTKVNADTSGGLKLTSDTSGNLDLQSAGSTKVAVTSSGASVTGEIALSSHLDMTDSGIIKLGSDDDLLIKHDGTNGSIVNSTGDLYLSDAGGNIYIQAKTGEQSIAAFADGAVDLYHNNVKKLETTATGITVTGGVAGVTDINSGQVGGRRNLLINGAQQIDQRNGGAGVTPNSVYITDRWKMQSQAGGSGAQITSTIAGFTKSLKYTGSENSSFLQLGQQIEYATYGHLAGSTITISFYAKANNTNSGSTALTVRTRSVTGVDGGALFAASNTDTSVTISTTAARYTVSRTIPADSKGFSIEFALGAHVNTDGFEITGIQAELGTVTAFEYTDIGTEEMACRRYFTKSDGDLYTGLLGFGLSSASGAFRDAGYFPTPMRANPTMAYTNLGSGWSAANSNSSKTHYTVELSKTTADVRPNYQFTASADF